MPNVDELPELGGKFSENCPKCDPRECYVECRHVNQFMGQYYNSENYINSPRHKALTESILNLQDSILQDICSFEFDICVKGSLVGFDCIQCEDVCQDGAEEFECGYDKIIFDNCVKTKIDFTSDPALQAIYENVINALSQSYPVNVLGVEQYADIIYNVNSGVIQFQNNTMYLDLARSLTAEEQQTWFFVKKTFPTPIGVDICLVQG